MKKTILSGICLFLTSVIIAQTAVMNVKETGTMKEEPVATYFLPRTVLEIEVEATKITRKAGPFAADARKYLGTPAEIQQNEEVWTINKINVRQKSEPDAAHQYKVYAAAKSNAAFLSLTETGILRGINLPFSANENDSFWKNWREEPEKKNKKTKSTPFISNFIVKEDGTAKKTDAAIAAEQISNLREVRLDILLQHNDVLHGRGAESYLQEIDKRESELTALFNGKEQKETVKKTFTVYPDKEMTNQEIFRFSEKQGFSDSGNAVVITLKKRDTSNKTVFSGKDKTGFVYRMPALAEVEITGSKTVFWTGTVGVAQLGKLAYLPVGFFDKNSAGALFDTKSGTLLQIGGR